MNIKEKKYILVLVLSIFISVTTLIGGSYALIQRILVGNNTYSMKTGNFLVEFLNSPEITLSNQLPTYDNVGMNNGSEMVFSVNNSGNYIASYSIKIEETCSESIKEIIRYAVDYGNGYSYENVHALSNNQYVVQNKSLEVGGKDTYKIRFWLDIDATEVYIDKVFSAKVVIESTQDDYKYAPNILDSVYAQDDKEGLTAVATNGTLHSNGEIREYRYSGNDVNNYVWFNCDTGYTSGSSHCEKWRIIGSFYNSYENGVGKYRVLKIVKDEAIGSEKYNTNTGNTANFDTSSIKKYLNETYYNSLSDNTKNLIMKANWHTASVLNKVSIKESYYIEQNNQSYNYVGLINTSDYGYASNNDLWETAIKDASITSSNNWLYQENSMLLNTKNISDTIVYYVSTNGIVEGNTTISYKIRPTVFLKPDVSIINGFGTSEEPYEISIKYPMNYGNKSDIKVSNTDVLYNVLKRNAVMDNVSSEYVESETGIDFTKISSNTNGRGLYTMADTKDEEYPIMYYRGNVDNNNVMFGGYCWQIVRTTETGGVKLIYNGTPGDVYEKTILKEEEYNIITNTGNFIYDEDSGYWKTIADSTNGLELSFNVPRDGNYILDILGYSSKGKGTFTIISGGENILNGTLSQGSTYATNKEMGTLKIDANITVTLTDVGWSWFYVRLINTGKLIGTGCDNRGNSAYIKTSLFNTNRISLAYNGYMYNKVYEYVDEAPVVNAYFANDVIWESGVYKLKNAEIGYMPSRHYTCNSMDINGICSTVRYYITNERYIEITNGKRINDAVIEMTSATDINQIDSQVKMELELWYKDNLLKYANNIEDTAWCNDRSISDYGSFNPSGSSNLIYKTYSRATANNINIECVNDVDKFSLGNPLAQLKYPIGLLSLDETRLAGSVITNENPIYYLYTNRYYWTMTPSYFDISGLGAREFRVHADGSMSSYYVSYAFDLRPSISLTNETTFIDGDGTKGNPYVIY